MKPQSRVIIENVRPNLEDGRYYAKSIVGDSFEVTADIFADGHDVLNAHLLYKEHDKKQWSEVPFTHVCNDGWIASFITKNHTYYDYKVHAWIDHALTWHHGLIKKIEAEVDVSVELKDGLEYLTFIAKKKLLVVTKSSLKSCIEAIKSSNNEYAIEQLRSIDIEALFRKYPTKSFKTEFNRELQVYADRERAAFSTWYEFFPRSASKTPGKHGTFKDCERLLPRIAEMGFDTLYFPPVHPIGEKNRKGKNNTTDAKPGDSGSPWAIGSKLGGHQTIHPELGTLADYKKLIKKASDLGIEVAMDFALQAAPDHPWIKEHPIWFKWRSDGTVQYAENPPKKYQDILPIHFETEDHEALWKELIGTVKFWVDAGVKVFRVDNPHTKPFHFWKVLIAEVKEHNKDILFLAEAFSRPRIMEGLAKAGFTQSYSYYTWRTNKSDLEEYVNQLTKTEMKDYMRANFWPNTPDILPYELQGANDTKFLIRYFMAFTLSSNAGVYGPAYEFGVSEAVPGKEEYWDSEKFEIKHWDWEKTNRITAHMTIINNIRKENAALQRTNNIEFCAIDNDNLLAYFKYHDVSNNYILSIVNLDSHNVQNGWVKVPIDRLGYGGDKEYLVKDLVTESSYYWKGEWNFVELRPSSLPYHLLQIQKNS